MTKEEILKYVKNTPENTNTNVLGSMIDSYVRSNGGGGSFGILYALSTEPAQTDPALPTPKPEGLVNYATPLSTTKDGEAMDYAALVNFFETHDIIAVNISNIAMIYEIEYPVSRSLTEGFDEENGGLLATLVTASEVQYGVSFTGGSPK